MGLSGTPIQITRCGNAPPASRRPAVHPTQTKPGFPATFWYPLRTQRSNGSHKATLGVVEVLQEQHVNCLESRGDLIWRPYVFVPLRYNLQDSYCCTSSIIGCKVYSIIIDCQLLQDGNYQVVQGSLIDEFQKKTTQLLFNACFVFSKLDRIRLVYSKPICWQPT